MVVALGDPKVIVREGILGYAAGWVGRGDCEHRCRAIGTHRAGDLLSGGGGSTSHGCRGQQVVLSLALSVG